MPKRNALSNDSAHSEKIALELKSENNGKVDAHKDKPLCEGGNTAGGVNKLGDEADSPAADRGLGEPARRRQGPR